MSLTSSKKQSQVPRLVLTLGDPCGVGPEVTLKLASDPAALQGYEVLVLSPPGYLSSLAAEFGVPWTAKAITSLPLERKAGRLLEYPVGGGLPAKRRVGRPDPACFPFIRESLRLGVELCKSGQAAALVTNPIAKSALTMLGRSYPGQTQFVADLCGSFNANPRRGLSSEPVMCMFGRKLRAFLVTDHLPLREVPSAVTAERLTEVIRIAHHAGRYFGLERPRIGVCGLNPHAGEHGLLGSEELDWLTATVHALQGEVEVSGPFAGDTIFCRALEGKLDFVVAMYHDQGLGPLKAVEFGHAVNVTLGIPILRTSVDHGTAYDIAGSFSADHSSLLAALTLAASMASQAQTTSTPEKTA